jgi:hypothetical protein
MQNSFITLANARAHRDGLANINQQATDANGRTYVHNELTADDKIVAHGIYARYGTATQTHTFSTLGTSAGRGIRFRQTDGGIKAAERAEDLVVKNGWLKSALSSAATDGEVAKALKDVYAFSNEENALAMTNARVLASHVAAQINLKPMYLTGYLVALAKHECALGWASGDAELRKIERSAAKFRPQIDAKARLNVMNKAETVLSYEAKHRRAIYINGTSFSARQNAILVLCAAGLKAVTFAGDEPGDAVIDDDFTALGVPNAVTGVNIGADADELPVPDPTVIRDTEHREEFDDDLAAYLYEADDNGVLQGTDYGLGAGRQATDGNSLPTSARCTVDVPIADAEIIVVYDRLDQSTTSVTNEVSRSRYIARIRAEMESRFTAAEIIDTLESYAVQTSSTDCLAFAQQLCAHSLLPHSTGYRNHNMRRISNDITGNKMHSIGCVFYTDIQARAYTQQFLPSHMPMYQLYRTLQIAALIEAAVLGYGTYMSPGLGGKRSPAANVTKYHAMTPFDLIDSVTPTLLHGCDGACFTKHAHLPRGLIGSTVGLDEATMMPLAPYARFEILKLLEGFNPEALKFTADISMIGGELHLSGHIVLDPVMQLLFKLTPRAERRVLAFIPHVVRGKAKTIVPANALGLTTKADWTNVALSRGRGNATDLARVRMCAVWGERGEGAAPITALPRTTPRNIPVTYILSAESIGTRYGQRATHQFFENYTILKRHLAGELSPYASVRFHLGAAPIAAFSRTLYDEDDDVEDTTPLPFLTDAKTEITQTETQSAPGASGFGVVTAGNRPQGADRMPPRPAGAGGGNGAGRQPPPPHGGAQSQTPPLVAQGLLAGAEQSPVAPAP